MRFDHHQKTFGDVFGEPFTAVKLSSAGLVYRHFGKQIISKLAEAHGVPLTDHLLQKIYLDVYKGFIEHVVCKDLSCLMLLRPLQYYYYCYY